jgi:hypothetical protein
MGERVAPGGAEKLLRGTLIFPPLASGEYMTMTTWHPNSFDILRAGQVKPLR